MQFTYFELLSREGVFEETFTRALPLLILSQTIAFLLYISTLRLFTTLFQVASHGLSLYALLFIIPKQLWTSLADIREKHQQNIFSTGFRLRSFFSRTAAYLRLLGDANRLYGAASFRYFLVSYPENAYMIMCLLFEGLEQPRSATFKLTLFTLLAQQLIIIFLVHVFSVRLATAVHRPVKPMTTLFLGSLNSNLQFSFRVRFKMAAYLQNFNVSKRYGVNYGKVGAMTYTSFGRSLIFYWKFLIYSYKLFS